MPPGVLSVFFALGGRNQEVEANDHREWVTSDIMARVLDDAFRAWNANTPCETDHRRTPRISAGNLPPLRIASFSIHNTTVECNESANIIDVSADGLHLSTRQAFPCGATVCFDLSSPDDEGHYGGATVVRCEHNGTFYDLGLQFGEDAGSLDVSEKIPSAHSTPEFFAPIKRFGARCISHLAFAYRVISGGAPSGILLTAHQGRHEAMFVVEAKLSRYTASLLVDDREIATRHGPLIDRFRNLISDKAEPTMLQLSGAGFTGWAVLRPNAVTAYSLTTDRSIPAQGKPIDVLTDPRRTGTVTGGSKKTTSVTDNLAQKAPA